MCSRVVIGFLLSRNHCLLPVLKEKGGVRSHWWSAPTTGFSSTEEVPGSTICAAVWTIAHHNACLPACAVLSSRLALLCCDVLTRLLGPGRLRGSLQRKAAALGGPDYSSWEGLWASLGSMAPKRMLPLLQVGGTKKQRHTHLLGRSCAPAAFDCCCCPTVVVCAALDVVLFRACFWHGTDTDHNPGPFVPYTSDSTVSCVFTFVFSL